MKFLSLLQSSIRRNGNHELTEREDEPRRGNGAKEETESSALTVTKGEDERSGINGEDERLRERNRRMDSPPVDDCCPICFGSFTVPCRAPCGHWYCGGCILLYWNYGAALQPCKCPMCSQRITRLIPDASLNCCQDGDVLENIRKYNRLFVGGTYGLFMKVVQLPLLLKRVFGAMMEPDADFHHYYKVRYFAMMLGALYAASPLDFLPRGRLDAVEIFDLFAVVLFFILRMVGVYIRWQRGRQARQLMR